MAISAKDVSALRAKTGVGMMDCKKALEETNGNFDEAIKLLREKGLAVAAKKADRIAAEGIVDISYCEKCNTAAMIEVNIETDFAAKSDGFQEFVKGCLNVILTEEPADVADLLTKQFGDGMTVDEMQKDKTMQIGEKISVRRFATAEGVLSTYVHNKGTIGVIVKVDADEKILADEGFAEFKKNLALQVASMAPVYISRADVPASIIDEEREITKNQINNDPDEIKKMEKVPEEKRADIMTKKIEGKISKYYETNCLLEQGYVKEDKSSVAEYIESYKKQAGGEVKVSLFYRFEKGEGLQKREDNFAEEIAQLTGNK